MVGGIEFHHRRGIARRNIADRAGGFRGRVLRVRVLSPISGMRGITGDTGGQLAPGLVSDGLV